MFFKTIVVVFLLPLSVQGQHLMVEDLQDELLCRAALQSCLPSVTCATSSTGRKQYCWQNQCTVKEYLSYGDTNGKKIQKLNQGGVLSSSLENPFLMDPEAAVFRSRILDCEDTTSARAILKATKTNLEKPKPAPTIEAASYKK